MNHNTPFRLSRTIVLGLVVATAIVTTSAVAASTGQAPHPFGLTVEPVAAPLPDLPPAATIKAAAASPALPDLPPAATIKAAAASTVQPDPPAATVEPVAPSTEPGSVQVAPVLASPVVEVRGGLDWADAGIGAGIAFGGILLLGGALLVVRRSAQRHRLATH